MNNRRKQKLVHRKFQIGLIVQFMMIHGVILLAFNGILFFFLQSELDANILRAHVYYKNTSSMLIPVSLSLSAINLLLMSLASAAAVLYASHKIAGPLFRFNEALKELASGNLTPLTGVRTDDQLKEVSASLGALKHALYSDVSAISTAIEVIDRQTKNSASGQQEPTMRAAIDTIQETVKRYRR